MADPVALKSTKTLSTVKLRRDATASKVTALNAVIDIKGPPAVIEAWAKKMNGAAVLEQLK